MRGKKTGTFLTKSPAYGTLKYYRPFFLVRKSFPCSFHSQRVLDPLPVHLRALLAVRHLARAVDVHEAMIEGLHVHNLKLEVLGEGNVVVRPKIAEITYRIEVVQ